MQHDLVLAINSGHGKWWYGIPVVAVVLIARVALFRRRRGSRFGWRNRDDGQR